MYSITMIIGIIAAYAIMLSKYAGMSDGVGLFIAANAVFAFFLSLLRIR